jgi:hypothetical protein
LPSLISLKSVFCDYWFHYYSNNELLHDHKQVQCHNKLLQIYYEYQPDIEPKSDVVVVKPVFLVPIGDLKSTYKSNVIPQSIIIKPRASPKLETWVLIHMKYEYLFNDKISWTRSDSLCLFRHVCLPDRGTWVPSLPCIEITQ